MYEIKNYRDLIKKMSPINADHFTLKKDIKQKLVSDFIDGLNEELKNKDREWDFSIEKKLMFYDALIRNELYGKDSIPIGTQMTTDVMRPYVDIAELVFWNVYIANSTRHDLCIEDSDFFEMKVHILEFEHLKTLTEYVLLDFKNEVVKYLDKLYCYKYSFNETINYSLDMLSYILINDQTEEGVISLIDRIYSRPRTMSSIDLCFGLSYELDKAFDEVLRSRRVKKSQHFEKTKDVLKELVLKFWKQVNIVQNRYFSISNEEVRSVMLNVLKLQIDPVIGIYNDDEYQKLSLLINGSEYPDVALGEFSVSIIQDDFENKVRFNANGFSRLLSMKGLKVENLVSIENGMTLNKLKNLRYGKVKKVMNRDYAYLSKSLNIRASELFIIEDIKEFKNRYLKSWFDGALEYSDCFTMIEKNNYQNQHLLIKKIVTDEKLYDPHGNKLSKEKKDLLADVLNTSIALMDKQLDEKDGIYRLCDLVKSLRKNSSR